MDDVAHFKLTCSLGMVRIALYRCSLTDITIPDSVPIPALVNIKYILKNDGDKLSPSSSLIRLVASFN